MLNELFGPSIYLLVMEMFLENPDAYMNVREIARMVEKNPGSVSRILPRLIDTGFLKQIQVGKSMYAYHLDGNNEIVRLVMEFRDKIEDRGKNTR
jgi:predicted transcriptional regulator